MDFAKSKFDTAANPPKSEEKSVQLADVHLYRSYFIQNPHFNGKAKVFLYLMKLNRNI